METEVGAASFVRDRESVAANLHLPSLHHRETDAAGADDDDAAVAASVCADTSNVGVIDINHGAKRMWSRDHFLEHAFAADTGEPHAGIHFGQSLWLQASFGSRRPAGSLQARKRSG